MFKKCYKNSDELNLFLEKNKTNFFDNILEILKKDINNNDKVVKVADIELLDEDCVLNISLDKSDCLLTLELAKKHYISLEQYEKCIEVDNIINELKYLFNI